MNLTQNVTVSGGLSAISTVWRYPGANYTRYGGGGLSFGPVGLKGTSSGGGSGQWVLAELLDLVSGERRACLVESCGPLPDPGNTAMKTHGLTKLGILGILIL